MNKFLLREVTSFSVESDLNQIGFDKQYSVKASEKYKYKNIKIYDLNSAQANIIKQTALSVGADCATHREVITGKIEKSDVILGGSYSELKKVADKLQYQPFSLSELANQIVAQLGIRTAKTRIIGILNITPDSFSDGGLYYNPNDAQKHLIKLIKDGADGIDIGAETTKPYSEPTSSKEQIERLAPVLKFIQLENIQIPISVDTRSSEVADFALNNGVKYINDVSGFDYDKKMTEIVAGYDAGIIIQHSNGEPFNMQDSPSYNNLIDEIFSSLKKKIDLAESFGIKNILVDAGIGFGKTKENNLEILNRIEEFFALNKPIMLGLSRKSFLGIVENNNDIKDSLTLALSYPLIKKRVDYLRVHNVKLHKQLLNLI